MIKQKLKTLYNKEYFPFIVLWILMFIMHMLMADSLGDDKAFSNVDGNLLNYLISKYYEWSSRLIIELAVVLTLKINILIWKIINTTIYTLLGFLLSKLFVNNNTRMINWFITGIMIIYPFYHMGTAGWVTTSVFYLWPLFLMIFCVFKVKRLLEKERLFWYEYPIYILALLYATNMEQTAMIMSVFYFVLIIKTIRNKNYHCLFGLSLGICVLNIIVAMLCPGNNARFISEMAGNFPNYNSLTILDKLNLGFCTTVMNFLLSYDGFFIVFCGIILFTAFFKHKKTRYFVIASIPCFIWAVLAPARVFLKLRQTSVSNNSFVTVVLKIIELGYKQSAPTELIIILPLLLVLTLIVLYLMVQAFDKEDIMSILFIIGLGFVSRVSMGFSPTVYVSGTRTYLYLYFSMIICLIILMNKHIVILNRKKMLANLFKMACIGSYIINMLIIHFVFTEQAFLR